MESHQSQCPHRVQNLLSILLCAAECWKTTVAIQRRLEVFQTKCLRHILMIYWPNTISNEVLRNKIVMDNLVEIMQAQRWLGHVCCLPPPPPITRTALRWTPQGMGKRGRPKGTWWHTVEKDLIIRGLSLDMAPRAVADQTR